MAWLHVGNALTGKPLIGRGDADILILPGLGNSGPGHWQTLWEAQHTELHRVHQQDWTKPVLENWLDGLDAAITGRQRPVILVAHSLGCLLAIYYAARRQPGKIAAAFLVAPPDVDGENAALCGLDDFSPVPGNILPFPSTVVASSNDLYADIGWSHAQAAAWGSRFVAIGNQGHINAESGHGTWDQGVGFLTELIARHTDNTSRVSQRTGAVATTYDQHVK